MVAPVVGGAKLAAWISAAAVPLLPFARRLAEQDACSGGSRRNLATAQNWTRFADAVDAAALRAEEEDIARFYMPSSARQERTA